MTEGTGTKGVKREWKTNILVGGKKKGVRSSNREVVQKKRLRGRVDVEREWEIEEDEV